MKLADSQSLCHSKMPSMRRKGTDMREKSGQVPHHQKPKKEAKQPRAGLF